MIGLKRRCEEDFCNFCCEKNIPWINKIQLYTCKKQCNLVSNQAKSKKGEVLWMNACINVSHPNYSIYAYCEDSFRGRYAQSICKADLCRLCCATTDEIRHTNITTNSLQQCFKQCSKTFTPSEKSEFDKLGLQHIKIKEESPICHGC